MFSLEWWRMRDVPEPTRTLRADCGRQVKL